MPDEGCGYDRIHMTGRFLPGVCPGRLITCADKGSTEMKGTVKPGICIGVL